MNFEWDEIKNGTNLRKHGIAFEDAVYVFADPFAISRKDSGSENEERWQILGQVQGIQMLLVVYTMRDETTDDVIRLISARKATGQERRLYENGTWFS